MVQCVGVKRITKLKRNNLLVSEYADFVAEVSTSMMWRRVLQSQKMIKLLPVRDTYGSRLSLRSW